MLVPCLPKYASSINHITNSLSLRPCLVTYAKQLVSLPERVVKTWLRDGGRVAGPRGQGEPALLHPEPA